MKIRGREGEKRKILESVITEEMEEHGSKEKQEEEEEEEDNV